MSSAASSTVRSVRRAVGRVPAKLWWRLALLVVLVVGGYFAVSATPLGDYFNREQLDRTIERLRAVPYAPLVLLGLYLLIGLFGMLPVTPLIVGGGLVFGPYYGALYNFLGMLLAAVVAFYVARLLGHEFVAHLIGPPLRRVERALERQGFWALVQLRFIPIPLTAVSYGAAFAGVKIGRFLLTSLIGLAPGTIIYTYFLPAVILEPSLRTLAAFFGVLGVFNLVLSWPTLRLRLRRKKRYQKLIARRRARER